MAGYYAKPKKKLKKKKPVTRGRPTKRKLRTSR